MLLGESEQWLIGRMGRQRVGELVVRHEIYTDRVEPFEEARVVRVEHGVGTDLRGVGALRPEQIHQVPAACFKGEVERREGFEVEAVAIAEEQVDERLLASLQRDLQCGGDPPASRFGLSRKLQRPSRVDPSLYSIEPLSFPKTHPCGHGEKFHPHTECSHSLVVMM